jgi:hypothetical protein
MVQVGDVEKVAGISSMNAVAERRKQVRYPVKEGAVVDLQQPRLFNLGQPKSVKLGSIVNICDGGLAVLYPGDNLRSMTADKLSISMPGTDIQIRDIPFKTITDSEVWMPASPEPARKCGVKFGKLNAEQKLLLNAFIREHSLPLAVQSKDIG